MELLQHKTTGEFFIKADGFYSANSENYNNWTNSIGYWIQKGLSLTDGKVVKSQVKRIVQLNNGASLDAKILALENDELKILAGRELLFEILQSTLVPSLMSLDEYEDARLYRKDVSKAARIQRWDNMISRFSDPDVLAQSAKMAFLEEELKKYKNDYLISDNKIFEAFINGTDHPIGAIPTYPRSVLFGTTDSALALDNLPLWDDPVLGGVDADYKSLVIGIIKGCIVDASCYYLS
jgi:hypothetical protein